MGSTFGSTWMRGADAVGAERQAEPGPLEQLVDTGAERALELAGVRALEADGDVGDGHDAVEVDEDRDEALLLLAVAERALEQARLAVFPRREQTDVVSADGGTEELVRLLVAVEQLLRRDRARVNEGFVSTIMSAANVPESTLATD